MRTLIQQYENIVAELLTQGTEKEVILKRLAIILSENARVNAILAERILVVIDQIPKKYGSSSLTLEQEICFDAIVTRIEFILSGLNYLQNSVSTPSFTHVP